MMHTKFKFSERTLFAAISLLLFFQMQAKAQTIPTLPANQLVVPAKTHSLRFYWQGDTVNGKWEQHTAMLIPVKLKNCPRQFFMQFDLGSPYSLLYKNKLMAIQAKYPKAISLPSETESITDFSFGLDKMSLLAKQIPVKQFDSSGINWDDKNAIEIIGTIGADLVDGRVVMIDYLKKRLTIASTIPADLDAGISFSDFIYAQRRILLPATLNGKQTILYFDTGSSMYELLTDETTARSLAVVGAAVIQNKVRSWNNQLTVNSLSSKDSIKIAGTIIPIRQVSFVETVNDTQVEQMKKMGIGGMTGNKLFLGYVLLLDTKNKKFALLKKKN